MRNFFMVLMVMGVSCLGNVNADTRRNDSIRIQQEITVLEKEQSKIVETIVKDIRKKISEDKNCILQNMTNKEIYSYAKEKAVLKKAYRDNMRKIILRQNKLKNLN